MKTQKILEENYSKKTAMILIQGALLNPLWWYLSRLIVPDGVDPIMGRVATSVLLLVFAGLVLLPRFKHRAEEIGIIPGVTWAAYAAWLVMANNVHPYYAVVAFLSTVTGSISYQKRSSIFIYVFFATIWAYFGLLGQGYQDKYRLLFVLAQTSGNLMSMGINVKRIDLITLLEDKNRFIDQVTQTVPVIIYVLNLKSQVIDYVNEQFKTVLGYELDQRALLGTNWKDVVHPEDVSRLGAIHFNSKRESQEPWTIEYRIKHVAGNWVWIHERGTVFRRDGDGNPTHLLCTLEDQSREKKLEEAREQDRLKMIIASKMSTLGEMAGGVAHEINNPLLIISGLGEQLEAQTELPNGPSREQIKKTSERIRNMVMRIAAIVRGLRAFARDGSADPFVSVKINDILQDVRELCMARFEASHIELVLPRVSEQWVLEARGVQIGQVLLNLLNNSFDAVTQIQSKRRVEVSVKDLDDHFEFRVSDTGPAISLEVQEKMMQPFFTTKEVGKGTGLGLSISDGLVRSHQGKLILESASPTTFLIVLPKVQHSTQSKNTELVYAKA